ncbi:MAG TPA: 2-amino-4-hydroxy-6-hydroxymethyldihydropteridine diphosphokinase [Longimicrobiales bacterium]|nr:2-amino-4-hydroxy-6-hydroxymethyldihydropteridine diphosphokinase [Longimicrobiales bacterium]
MTQEPRWAVFALGGNLDDPLATLRVAVGRLAAVLEAPRVSAVYRTRPEGGADQPCYLNATVAGATLLSPREVLGLAQALEADAGRVRPYPGAPRSLDVDVVFLGDTVVDEPGLRIPHPRWAGRDFVVIPLLDIVPDFLDPESGRTVRDVAAAAGWLGMTLPRELEPGDLLALEAS